MKILSLLCLFLVTSCSLLEQKKVTSNIDNEIPKICLSASGRGRLIVSGHKFLFKFRSALEQDTNEWFMSLVFPLYGEESFSIEWDAQKVISYNATFENKILQDKKKVDPEALNSFLEKWAELVWEITRFKNQQKFDPNFEWSTTSKKLSAFKKLSDKSSIKLEFKNLTAQGYFGRYDVFMRSELEDAVKLELIVRKCLEKPE